MTHARQKSPTQVSLPWFNRVFSSFLPQFISVLLRWSGKSVGVVVCECELTDGLDLLMWRYTYCTYTVRLRCAPQKNWKTQSGDSVEQSPPAKCLQRGAATGERFGHCRATVRRLQNHPSSLFPLDRRAEPHARGEDIKGLTMGAEAIDLFKTTAVKGWRSAKICGVSAHLCIFHRLIRSDSQWVNTVSRSYLLLRTQTWGLD